jgi:hypothetical protein
LSETTTSSGSVGYYLSTNAVLDAADQLLGNRLSFRWPLAKRRRARQPVPAGTAPGNYFVLFVADYLNRNGKQQGQQRDSVNISVTPVALT